MPDSPLLIEIALLPVIGLVAGVLGGMLGIGGGLVIIPALLLALGRTAYGPGSLHLYKLAALLTAVVLSIPAARQHLRAGAVVPRMLPSIEVFGVAGVLVGVWSAAQLAGDLTRVLQRIFGAAMVLFVGAQLWVGRSMRTDGTARVASCPTAARWGRIGMIVGLPAGFVSGLLGIGGGVWAVPAQNLWLGVRLRSAIANSTCMIVGVAIASAGAQAVAIARMGDARLDWLEAVRLAAWLSPGALLGGLVGGRLTHRLPVEAVRRVFFAVLVITGVRLWLGASRS